MRSLIILAASLTLLTACGYKGPLYLPPPAADKPASKAPADDNKAVPASARPAS